MGRSARSNSEPPPVRRSPEPTPRVPCRGAPPWSGALKWSETTTCTQYTGGIAQEQGRTRFHPHPRSPAAGIGRWRLPQQMLDLRRCPMQRRGD
jgi:hypothetical protein